MTNPKAQTLIDKIITDLERNGIIINTIIEDLKKLRPFSVEEKRPVVAKAIRQLYEHIEEFETFAIPIPQDEDLTTEDSEDENPPAETQSSPTESLMYLMLLIKNEEHRRNKQEIRIYNQALKEYSDLYGE